MCSAECKFAMIYISKTETTQHVGRGYNVLLSNNIVIIKNVKGIHLNKIALICRTSVYRNVKYLYVK